LADVPSLYRENVLEIIDRWGGYPLKDPCSGDPAQYSGSVEMRCFINNTCPFYGSPVKEDGLVFNDRTFERIKPWLPDSHKNVLTVTPNTDGIHFKPKYVFRNNYIYKYVPQDGNTPITDPSLFGDNFETYFKEITQNGGGVTAPVPNADKTRYKAEQSWFIMPSVFDDNSTLEGIDECTSAEWTYLDQTVSESEVTYSDLSYDYIKSTYEEYDNSLDDEGRLIAGKVPVILPYHVQMPLQKKVHGDRGEGNHWRLGKRTFLYRGEDFFIRFYKQAKKTTIKSSEKYIPSFNNNKYSYLDITANQDVLMVNNSDFKLPTNYAVRPPTVGNQTPDFKSFDFSSQGYYIIELGAGLTDHYFIIITERANPIFVNVVPGKDGFVSKKFSTFEGTVGSKLINADYFDITVRNHLGSLVIQFSGPGIDVPPWVVKRLDWEYDWDPNTRQPILKEKLRTLFVPRGPMHLWGGNLRAGFVFGPLQYQERYISFVYPPRPLMADESMEMAFREGRPEAISSSESQGAFSSQPFFLPYQGNHHILFSSADIYLQDLGSHVAPVGEPLLNQPLFVQDSQFYKEYHESNNNMINSNYRYGGFFYDETLKEFPDVGGNDTIYKTSNIVVRKYRYRNDDKTRHQAFDVILGMMTGDHIFKVGAAERPSVVSERTDQNTLDTLSDDEWFLPDCKTPVLTSMRLIADHSSLPRWDDNTSSAEGVTPNPFVAQSPYFVDATEHVLTYGDTWSSSGFSEIEHTGTLHFYLNREMPVENNVTDFLLALQNKTFYVEIWVGYQNCAYSRVTGFYKLFTGLCHGGKIDYEYGKNIMSCKIEDYTAVLKGTRFFNSPWFDGVKDINAIYEIMQIAGFRDENKYDPGSLIRNLSASANALSPGVFYHHFDGRLFKMEPYALPSGYNRLEQPSFKFDDGDVYMDAISKIAKRAAKVFFFDQFGIAHYEDFQDIIEQDYLGLVPLAPLYYFTINPEKYPGQLVFNKVERNYEVSGVYNHIKIMSNTPDMHLLIRDELNWSAMENPETEGFLGYLKTMYQQEGMFGSIEAVNATVRKYSVAFRPKVNIKFETYGLPLRANDIIRINNEDCRVVKVTHSINAEKNEWWMNVECMRYQPIQAATTVL